MKMGEQDRKIGDDADIAYSENGEEDREECLTSDQDDTSDYEEREKQQIYSYQVLIF